MPLTGFAHEQMGRENGGENARVRRQRVCACTFFRALHKGCFAAQPIRNRFEGQPMTILLAGNIFLLCVPLKTANCKSKFCIDVLLEMAARPILSDIVMNNYENSENALTDVE